MRVISMAVLRVHKRIPNIQKAPSGLPDFQPADPVWVRNFGHGRRWCPGVIRGSEGSRLVKVDTPEGPTRRHLDQIRPLMSPGSSKGRHFWISTAQPRQRGAASINTGAAIKPGHSSMHERCSRSFGNATNISSSCGCFPNSSSLTMIYPTTKARAKTQSLKEREK
ncbi:hypothetical protein MRX96_038893 [Rhipicephalus microplus]